MTSERKEIKFVKYPSISLIYGKFEFLVEKNILSNVSEYFNNLFNKSSDTIISVNEEDFPALEQYLQIVYKLCNINNTYDNVYNILYTAHKLDTKSKYMNKLITLLFFNELNEELTVDELKCVAFLQNIGIRQNLFGFDTDKFFGIKKNIMERFRYYFTQLQQLSKEEILNIIVPEYDTIEEIRNIIEPDDNVEPDDNFEPDDNVEDYDEPSIIRGPAKKIVKVMN